jgi:cytoskeletal protein CcmA (bactofilin family)
VVADKDDLDIPTKPERPSRRQPATFAGFSFGAEPPLGTPEPENGRDGKGAAAVEVGTLMVGRQVSFIGVIKACKRLVVEGNVDANLQRCETVEVAETGLLQGQVGTDLAEVRGRFEGELVVKRRLTIKHNGQVSGTTTYREIEIERGGRIVGDVTACNGASGSWPQWAR